MKKVYGVILILIVLIITFINFKDTNDLSKETNKSTSEIEDNVEENKVLHNIENKFKVNDIIIFDTTYDELIDIMGRPISITNIDDENIITNYGYFSVLSYEGVEFTINLNNSFDDLTSGTVTEIDIVSPDVSTEKGITIGDTKDKVKKIYSIEKTYPLKTNTEFPLHTIVIKGIKRGEQEIDISKYDKYCYIQSEKKPVALIFLFKENIIKRIVIRNITAS